MIRISGSFTQILLAWMHRKGIESEDLSTRLLLLAEKETIDAGEWRALLAEAAVLSPNQPIGIDIGSEVQIRHTGVLGYLVLNSDNLADALETYLLCERHFYSVNFAQLSCKDSRWTLSWPDQLGAENALFVQVALTALVTFLRQRFPGACDLLAVSLTGEEPEDKRAFEQYFGCPVEFGSSYPGVCFDGNSVHRPAQGALAGDFHAMRRQQVEAFSSVITTEDPFLQRLQHILLKLIPDGQASLPKVAVALNSSPRSVQRKLAVYNLSYRMLLEGVREQLARRYLARTSLSLSELPLLMGFSDQSAFSRAFKSWTGVTPGKFRRAGQ